MISVKYNNLVLTYDEAKNEISVNGTVDSKKKFSPSFVHNGVKEPTFIGFIDLEKFKLITLSGKEFSIVEPKDITL